jgi:glyoxylase-like metal-dependent hydrolase (beta-lactamase superfamily II)
MVGYCPTHCPFCGAAREIFITSEECSAQFQVKGIPVSEKVTRLNSVPALGIEHAAYRIETKGKAFWIDCPSSFDKSLEPADVLMFTHHHFLGASNQYRDLFSCEVRIHKLDSAHDLCRGFTFDGTFEQNFEENGIEAFHIDGHTPGFSFYILEDILLVCDYVFLKDDGMIFNPYGPVEETITGGEKIQKILDGRDIRQVCGYNYVVAWEEWKKRFGTLPGPVGH